MENVAGSILIEKCVKPISFYQKGVHNLIFVAFFLLVVNSRYPIPNPIHAFSYLSRFAGLVLFR